MHGFLDFEDPILSLRLTLDTTLDRRAVGPYTCEKDQTDKSIFKSLNVKHDEQAFILETQHFRQTSEIAVLQFGAA